MEEKDEGIKVIMNLIMATLTVVLFTAIIGTAFIGTSYMQEREDIVLSEVGDGEVIENVERLEEWGGKDNKTIVTVLTDKYMYTGIFEVKSFLDSNTEPLDITKGERQ